MSNKKPYYLFKLKAIVDYTGEALDDVNKRIKELTGHTISLRTDNPVEICVMRADTADELPSETLDEIKTNFIDAAKEAFDGRQFKLSSIRVDIERKNV